MQASAKEYAQAWYQALKETKDSSWNEISEKMLRRLQREGRLNEISHIVDLFEEIADQEQGVTAVAATLAHPMDEAMVADVAKTLLGVKEVRLDVKQDDALLGGIKLETKNRVWDLSVRRRLENLRTSLDS